MKKWIPLTALTLVAYAGFMVTELPASFVWDKMPNIRGVKMEGISGSLWSGSAQLVTIDRNELTNVHWQMEPLRLLKGELAMNMQMGDYFSELAGSATLAYSLDGLMLENPVSEGEDIPISLKRTVSKPDAEGRYPVRLKGRI